MTINGTSIQCNGGFLPDIILLTQGYYYHRGTHLDVMRFCTCSLIWYQVHNNLIHVVESPYGLVVKR